MAGTIYEQFPVDPSKMINCVTDHGRVSVTSVQATITSQLQKYYDYDKENDTSAAVFLIDSLTTELSTDMYDLKDTNDPFPVVFLRPMQLLQSTSIHRFDHLKTRIKGRKPQQYPGQDLMKMARDFRADAYELEIAGQYYHTLTMNLMQALLQADDSGFKVLMTILEQKLDGVLVRAGHMPLTARQFLLQEGCTYKQGCEKVVAEYRRLLNNGRWTPARSTHDSSAPRTSFGNVVMATPAQAFALIQQQNGTTGTAKPEDYCLSCGQQGHWACDSPLRTHSGTRPNIGGRHNNQRGPNWKKTPQAPGTPRDEAVQWKDLALVSTQFPLVYL